ncbi:MAG: cobyric acid synthase [Bacteroidales bacterium]|nr:cobyric acid synthase [Bacteroidales bacterium]
MKTGLHNLMLAGTGSDVGKSIIATALCRILLQDGYAPAPFKAQNMALNSFATKDGLEIGRAQAVQAEAAGLECHTDMNPLLLKPQSDHISQVVLNGKPIGSSSAYDYFRKEGKEELRVAVCKAFDRLSKRYNPIVMEGAGSVSELNLAESDIVNLPMAKYANADVFLVADIDRGGVFASVYGSIALQKPEYKSLIKGVIINKFRGDLRLFYEGRKILEDICKVPVLGVIPYYKDIYIEEEDSVDLARKSFSMEKGKINVAVVLLRHISNFTDFNMLERDPRVHLYYTSNTEDIKKSDIIIIPGTKSTIDDLYELRRNGCAQAIISAHRNGATVLGICGGYQMMGQQVLDPDHIEGDTTMLPGLGLLPVITRMTKEKVTRQTRFSIKHLQVLSQADQSSDTDSCRMTGYEIHMGETSAADGYEIQPLAILDNGKAEGCFVDNKTMGCYLHGILDNPKFIDFMLEPFKEKTEAKTMAEDYTAFKQRQYDLLADHVRKHIDMNLLYKILSND